MNQDAPIEEPVRHPTADEVSVALDVFEAYMREKMVRNLHKPHWLDQDERWFQHRIEAETRELDLALNQLFHPAREETEASLVETIYECADIANCAMMLALILHERLPSRGTEGSEGPRT